MCACSVFTLLLTHNMNMNLDANCDCRDQSEGSNDAGLKVPRRLGRKAGCCGRCFTCSRSDVNGLAVSFLIETQLRNFRELTAGTQNAIRCLLVQAQVRIREARRGEVLCSPSRTITCVGHELYGLVAADHFNRTEKVADFQSGLKDLHSAVHAQMHDLHRDVFGGEMPPLTVDELQALLSDREQKWMLRFWRRLEEQCTEAPTAPASNSALASSSSHSGAHQVEPLSRSLTSPVAAARLRDYLRRMLLRQSEFAVMAGITEKTLRKVLKTGRGKVLVFEQIASAMGTTKAELLTSAGDHGPPIEPASIPVRRSVPSESAG